MPTSIHDPGPCNLILSRLPETEMARLRPHLQPVELVAAQVLHETGAPIEEAYFLESGLVSLTADTGDGNAIEVGMTGRDGVSGASALLNADALAAHRAMVQIAGRAQRVPIDVLRALTGELPELRDLCLRCLHVAMIQSAQSAACNARHHLSQRLARWLLMARDRVGSDDLAFTQDLVSKMLGVRRAGVSAALQGLESKSLIRAARGHVLVLDAPGLKDEACYCYGFVERHWSRIMRSTR